MKYFLLVVFTAFSLIGATPVDEAIADIANDLNYATLLRYTEEATGQDAEEFVVMLKNRKDELLDYKNGFLMVHGHDIFLGSVAVVSALACGLDPLTLRLAEWKMRQSLPTFTACRQHIFPARISSTGAACITCEAMLPNGQQYLSSYGAYKNFIDYKHKIGGAILFGAAALVATGFAAMLGAIAQNTWYTHVMDGDKQLGRLDNLINLMEKSQASA